MNPIKRILGVVWIALGPAAIFFMFREAINAIGQASNKIAVATGPALEAALLAKTNAILQWSIIIAVFVPVMIGLVIFGKYALSGAYDNLPESSEEL